MELPEQATSRLNADLKSVEEQMILDALRNGGGSRKNAAEILGISPRTVTSHLDHIYTKLGIGSRQELTARLRP